MDTTQDISKVDQLSIVVWYAVRTRSENRQTIDIEVKEVFLGCYAAIKYGTTDINKQVTTLSIDKNIDLKKCAGQGYDGTNVISTECVMVYKNRLRIFSLTRSTYITPPII
ncbi:zinc finger MYM-type protein 1-like [Trichonephila clavata]|uniref:Zinc finger MYM-type protein 1-like n=1 Tax=Trichonephila clavata TaxID=2740835 RepID=A0A8X6HUT3_TRICU|nr:zinc finger MYM-type protein 1-like [Trichonephila clavata]